MFPFLRIEFDPRAERSVCITIEAERESPTEHLADKQIARLQLFKTVEKRAEGVCARRAASQRRNPAPANRVGAGVREASTSSRNGRPRPQNIAGCSGRS